MVSHMYSRLQCLILYSLSPLLVGNPAVCPVRDISTTLQGGLVELKVYVSSYPLLTGSQIHWYRPNGNEIFASEPNVQFVNSRKSLILSNVQLADFGRYEVEGLLTSGPIVIGRDRTGITLDIQGLYKMYYP